MDLAILRTPVVAVALLAGAPPGPFETPIASGVPAVSYGGWYGPATQAALARLSSPLGDLQRRVVRTKGLFERTLDGSLRLRDSVHAVLLIPVAELDSHEVRRLLGQEVEIVGFTRELPERQGTCRYKGQEVPASFCEDWLLPPLPDRAGHPDWPLNSVTFWTIFEVGTSDTTDSANASTLAGVVSARERFVGQTVTVEGYFRGANLFGDLPDDTRRVPSDWVLSDGTAALWVTGKPPSGDGFRLGLNAKEDTRWWLEVTGKVEAGAATYLRAKKVVLKKRREPRPAPSPSPQASR